MHTYYSHLKIFCRLFHISAVLQAGAVTLGVGSSGSGNGPQLSLSGGYASTGAGGSVLLRTGGSATAATGDLDMFTASSTSGKYKTVTSTLIFFFIVLQTSDTQLEADMSSWVPAPVYRPPDKLRFQAVQPRAASRGQVGVLLLFKM
jgi:hypothetical protein